MTHNNEYGLIYEHTSRSPLFQPALLGSISYFIIYNFPPKTWTEKTAEKSLYYYFLLQNCSISIGSSTKIEIWALEVDLDTSNQISKIVFFYTENLNRIPILQAWFHNEFQFRNIIRLKIYKVWMLSSPAVKFGTIWLSSRDKRALQSQVPACGQESADIEVLL